MVSKRLIFISMMLVSGIATAQVPYGYYQQPVPASCPPGYFPQNNVCYPVQQQYAPQYNPGYNLVVPLINNWGTHEMWEHRGYGGHRGGHWGRD